MGTSIGLLEIKNIPVGIQAADEILKSADIKMWTATSVCPGKYIIAVTGSLGPVRAAMAAGRRVAEPFVVMDRVINHVREDLPAAIWGMVSVEEYAAIGVIETISALSAITVGDMVTSAANVKLAAVRVAHGLGGKGLVVFTGDVSAVRVAVRRCGQRLADTGEITSHCVIPSPHPDLIKALSAL